MRMDFSGFFSTLLFVGLVGAGFHFGWFSFFGLVDFLLAFVGMVSLLLILRQPWDLYFEARNLRLEQKDSLQKSIQISEDDLNYTRRLVPRLLLLCLGLHFLAAGVTFAVAWYSKGVLGYWFSGFFLLSTVFRPIHAFYTHQKKRLRDLRSRCLLPREDAAGLFERLRSLEANLQDLSQTVKTDRENQERNLEEMTGNFEKLRTGTTTEVRRFNDRVSQVCDEFQKSIEKLTEDQELLRGIRAFVHLIKNTP
jgi:hypothetical protein